MEKEEKSAGEIFAEEIQGRARWLGFYELAEMLADYHNPDTLAARIKEIACALIDRYNGSSVSCGDIAQQLKHLAEFLPLVFYAAETAERYELSAHSQELPSLTDRGLSKSRAALAIQLWDKLKNHPEEIHPVFLNEVVLRLQKTSDEKEADELFIFLLKRADWIEQQIREKTDSQFPAQRLLRLAGYSLSAKTSQTKYDRLEKYDHLPPITKIMLIGWIKNLKPQEAARMTALLEPLWDATGRMWQQITSKAILAAVVTPKLQNEVRNELSNLEIQLRQEVPEVRDGNFLVTLRASESLRDVIVSLNSNRPGYKTENKNQTGRFEDKLKLMVQQTIDQLKGLAKFPVIEKLVFEITVCEERAFICKNRPINFYLDDFSLEMEKPPCGD